MTSAHKRKLKREYTPKYFRNFNIGMCVALIGTVLIGIGVCLAFGLTLGEHPATYVSIAVVVLVALALSIVAIVVSVSFQKRLVAQRTDEVLNEFSDMPFEQAEKELADKRVITEYGFVANVGEYAGQLVVPFKDALVSVHSANIYTKVVTVILISDASGFIRAQYVLDKLLYNYVLKKGLRIDFQGYSNLIVSSKNQFVRNYITGGSDRTTMFVLFGALGAYLSDESKNLNNSRRIVLDVLDREIV